MEASHRATKTAAILHSTRPRPDMVMGIAESIFTKGYQNVLRVMRIDYA